MTTTRRSRTVTLLAAAAVAVATLAAPASAEVPVTAFVDVPVGHTFHGDIMWLSENRLTTGCTPTRYCPDEPVTRGEMAAFLTRAFGLDQRVVYNYVDVPTDHTFRWNIGALTDAGITTGCDTAPLKFCPDDPVTRAQMMAFLNRAFAWPDRGIVHNYTDVPPGHTFAYDIGAATDRGVTTGCAVDRFCPDAPVTRGQMAAFLHRGFGA